MVCGHVHFSLSWIQVRPRRPTAGRHQDAPCADHEPQPHGTGIGANRPGLQMRVEGSALAWDCHGLSGHGAIRDGRNPGTANASGHDPPLRRGSGNFHGNKPSIVNQWKSYCTGGFPNGPRRSRIYGGSGRVRSPPSEFHQPTDSNTGVGRAMRRKSAGSRFATLWRIPHSRRLAPDRASRTQGSNGHQGSRRLKPPPVGAPTWRKEPAQSCDLVSAEKPPFWSLSRLLPSSLTPT